MKILINIKQTSLSSHFNMQIQSVIPARLWGEKDTG